MVLHVFISFLGGVPLCIPYSLYSGTSVGETTRGILGGFSGRVLSAFPLVFSKMILNIKRNHFLYYFLIETFKT